jgi:hypothetical protein
MWWLWNPFNWFAWRGFDQARWNAACAIVNLIQDPMYKKTETPVTVRAAQLMDRMGNMRVYTSDGRQYVVRIDEISL